MQGLFFPPTIATWQLKKYLCNCVLSFSNKSQISSTVGHFYCLKLNKCMPITHQV